MTDRYDHLYAGIEIACAYWSDATMLQHTFECLKRELEAESDAVVDCAKGLVECVCKLIIEELHSEADPILPEKVAPSLGELINAAAKGVGFGDERETTFLAVVSQHKRLASKLNDARNGAGPTSHGKDAYLDILSTHQRRSVVISADCLITFLYEAFVHVFPNVNLRRTRQPYEQFENWNQQIDDACLVEATGSDDNRSLEISFRFPNGEEPVLIVQPSELLFGLDREMYVSARNAARESHEGTDE